MKSDIQWLIDELTQQIAHFIDDHYNDEIEVEVGDIARLLSTIDAQDARIKFLEATK
jgi:hypothetical protein